MPPLLLTNLTPALAGILQFLSWTGLGLLLHRLITPRTPIDLPLRTAWGLALTLLLGGLAQFLHLVSPLFLQLLTLTGLLALPLLLLNPRSRATPPRISHPHPLQKFHFALPLSIALLAVYSAALFNQDINRADDMHAYLPFIKQLLQTGAIDAPFDLRRITSFGGQTFLHAQLLAILQLFLGPDILTTGTAHAILLDRGIAMLLLAALAHRLLRTHTTRQRLLALLLVFIALFTPIPRLNIASQATGMVLFLALLRTLRYFPVTRPGSIRLALILGIVAAAVATLRANFLFAAALTLAFAFAERLLRSCHRLRASAPFAVALLAFLLSLLPWALALRSSSGTLLYPLFAGNARNMAILQDASISQSTRLWSALATLISPRLLILLLPAGFILFARNRRSAASRALYAAGLLTLLASVWAFSRVDLLSAHRYCMPILFPAALFTLASALRTLKTPLTRTHYLALALLLLQPLAQVTNLADFFTPPYTSLVLLSSVLLLWTFFSPGPLLRRIFIAALFTASFAVLVVNRDAILRQSSALFWLASVFLVLILLLIESKKHFFSSLYLLPLLAALALFATPDLYASFSVGPTLPIIALLLLILVFAARFKLTLAPSWLPLILLLLLASPLSRSMHRWIRPWPEPTLSKSDLASRADITTAQQLVPPGEKLLVIATNSAQALYLNYSTHQILALDEYPGSVTPIPSLAAPGTTPETLRTALHAAGIHFLMLPRDRTTAALSPEHTAALTPLFDLAKTAPILTSNDSVQIIQIPPSPQ